jgi:hypothetical protein
MSRGKIAAAMAGAGLAVVLAVAAGCAAPTGPVANTASEQIKKKTASQEATVNAAIEKARSAVSTVAATVGTVEAKQSAQKIDAKLKQLQDQLTSALHETGTAKITAVKNVSAAFNTAVKDIDDAANAAPAGSARQTALLKLSAKLKSAQAELAAAVAGAK